MDYDKFTKEYHIRGVKNAMAFGLILGTMLGGLLVYAAVIIELI